MGTRIICLDIVSPKKPEEIRQSIQLALRSTGGVIQNTPTGFDIEGGGIGVQFEFVAKFNTKVTISLRSPDHYYLECQINWNPNFLFWIGVIAGPFLFFIPWIVPLLYFFIDPSKVYMQALERAKKDLESEQSVQDSSSATVTMKPDQTFAPTNAPQGAAIDIKENPIERLGQIKKMLDAGLISDEEYQAKKEEIIKLI